MIRSSSPLITVLVSPFSEDPLHRRRGRADVEGHTVTHSVWDFMQLNSKASPWSAGKTPSHPETQTGSSLVAAAQVILILVVGTVN